MAEPAELPPYAGFGTGAVAWFEGLEEDNSREYWAATKAAWASEVREPLEALLAELSAGWGGDWRTFRPHRDVRFSPDKSPLKTRSYGVVARAGSVAAVYVEVSAAGLLAGTGYHEPAPDQLGRYRAGVLDEEGGRALESAVAAAEAAGLELGSPALRTTPRGVPRDHPRAGLLRFTSLILIARAPREGMRGRAALDLARRLAADAAPVTDWLDARVGPSSEPLRRRTRPGGSARPRGPA